MKTIKNYIRAQSLEEAYNLNQKKTNKIIGGMLWLKMQTGNLQNAIDLCDLHLDTIEENEESFTIGAMTSLRQLECHESLNAFCNGSIKKALSGIVGVQFRNLATIGGSIWGRYGFSDVLTVFLGMDTYVNLYNGGSIPLKDFTTMSYDNDLLLSITVMKTPVYIAYQAVRNTRTDFPVLTCAVSSIGKKYQAVIGARPGRALVIEDKKQLLSGGISPESADSFGDYVAQNIITGTNMRGSKEYRKHLAKVLTSRCLLELKGVL